MGSGFWDGIPADYANRFTRITSIRRNMANHQSIKAYYDSMELSGFQDRVLAQDVPLAPIALAFQMRQAPRTLRVVSGLIRG